MSQEDESDVMFRMARPQDASEILQVSYECRVATYPSYIPEPHREQFLRYERITPERKQKLTRMLAKNNTNEWRMVASYNGKIVGYVYCEVIEKIMQIRNLFILPKHQGKGIGKKLLMNALEWSPVDTTHLRALATNAPAINLYSKYGFVPNGRTIRYFGCTKIEMIRVI